MNNISIISFCLILVLLSFEHDGGNATYNYIKNIENVNSTNNISLGINVNITNDNYGTTFSNYSKTLKGLRMKEIGTGRVVMTYKGSINVSNPYTSNGTFLVITPSAASNERQSRNVTIKMMIGSNIVAFGNCTCPRCAFLYDSHNTETIRLNFSVPTGTHILYYEVNITTYINNFNYTIRSLSKGGNDSYLQNDSLTQWTPEIQSMSQNLTRNSTTDFEKVGKISRWVHENIKYNISLADKPYNASWVYENRMGVCIHYANLLISMCRAINIPARGVYGEIYNGSGYSEGHAWAEVLMDGKWYPVDPTFNEIGFIDSGHLTTGYNLSVSSTPLFSVYSYGLNINNHSISPPSLKVLNAVSTGSIPPIINITPKWRVINVNWNTNTVTYEITGIFTNYRGQGYIIGNAYLQPVRNSTLLSDYIHQLYVGQNKANASWRFNITLRNLLTDYTLPLTISTEPTPITFANFNASTAATFEIYDVQVPVTIQRRATATINVTIRNIGVKHGTSHVKFYVNDIQEGEQNLSISGISGINTTQFNLNPTLLSQGEHTIKFVVKKGDVIHDVVTKTFTVGPLPCVSNYNCSWNEFCNSSLQCEPLSCPANQIPYNHTCIDCIPFDLDGNNVTDIFDVVAGLEHLSEGRQIHNEICTARNRQKIDLFDLLTGFFVINL